MSFLHSELERAQARLQFARRELERFERLMNEDSDHQQRERRKLLSALEAAERDVGYAQHRLDMAHAAFKDEATNA
jgi:hypothetical protein